MVSEPKRKRGRPPFHPEARRSRRILVRMVPNQWDAAHDRADFHGLTMVDYIRYLVDRDIA